MQVQDLKEYIINNDYIERILEELGCGHIRNRGDYITASNPNGDNAQAVVVYKSENLTTVNYTRQIAKNKRATDLFDLIMFYNDCTFAEALKWACGVLGLDYYSEPNELCELFQILRMLKDMPTEDGDNDNTPLEPIPEEILSYYLPYGNKMWCDEGISLRTQEFFNIMYDPWSNYIVIPIYDSIGSLVGIKGRYFGEPDEYHSKFFYLEKTNKSKILYGLWQNREFIKNNRYIIIAESEKSVLKLAEYGYRNAVATGGKCISKHQIELITRSGCTPILALDKDVSREELDHIASQFMDGIDVYAIIDTQELLDKKESPMDREDVWRKLHEECIYKIK